MMISLVLPLVHWLVTFQLLYFLLVLFCTFSACFIWSFRWGSGTICLKLDRKHSLVSDLGSVDYLSFVMNQRSVEFDLNPTRSHRLSWFIWIYFYTINQLRSHFYPTSWITIWLNGSLNELELPLLVLLVAKILSHNWLLWLQVLSYLLPCWERILSNHRMR